MYKPIITCAVTGAETTKQDNPNLPVSSVEIADAAYEAFLAGASVLHLHVRDKEGEKGDALALLTFEKEGDSPFLNSKKARTSP